MKSKCVLLMLSLALGSSAFAGAQDKAQASANANVAAQPGAVPDALPQGLSVVHSKWLLAHRPGADLRPLYAQVLSKPELGGYQFASEIEGYCLTARVRAEGARSPQQLAANVNSPDFAAHLAAVDSMSSACASLTDDEISGVNAHRRANRSELFSKDPLLSLTRKILDAKTDAQRDALIVPVLAIGPPANLVLVQWLMARDDERSRYLLFDGVKYRVIADAQGRVSGTSSQLMTAFIQAACALGLPCQRGSLKMTMACIDRPQECGQTDYTVVIRHELEAGGFTDLARALPEIELLRARFVAAISGRDRSAFASRP